MQIYFGLEMQVKLKCINGFTVHDFLSTVHATFVRAIDCFVYFCIVIYILFAGPFPPSSTLYYWAKRPTVPWWSCMSYLHKLLCHMRNVASHFIKDQSSQGYELGVTVWGQ